MKLTGAEILIRTLIEQGVSNVFGYPGGQVVHIYDALYRHSDEIRHVLTAHEQGAAHAADGYARASGKVGVVIATSGPGATNLVTGIATAMLDSVPMIAITGNVPCDMIGRDSFQEIDITGITLPITKHNYFVNHVEELADVIREAFAIASSGRPGPVLIDIPKDVQEAETEFVPSTPQAKIALSRIDESLLNHAVEMINESDRPYLFIGGGATVLGLGESLTKLAERIDGYVGSTLMGLSALATSSPRFLGMNGMHGHYASVAAMNHADLVIAVGVRFSDRSTGIREEFLPDAKIIHLDADFAEINKNIKVDLGIVGDVGDAIARISKLVKPKRRVAWQSVVDKLRKKEAEILRGANAAKIGVSPYDIFDVINNANIGDFVFATDVGQHQMWAAQSLRLTAPRRLITSGGLGTMGFGLGAAVGAYLATDNIPVLITGDGSFGMNLCELATAVRYNIPLVIVIFNNGVLGMVRQWQTVYFDSRYSQTILDRKTDFVKLAEAFGARGFRAENIADFANCFAEAVKLHAPAVIDVSVDPELTVLPAIPPSYLTDDITIETEDKR